MKTTILQEVLKEGLGIISHIPSKNITLPILNNVLLRAEKNFLNLAATDLEIGLNFWALAKTAKEGALALPIQALSGLISLFPNKPIEIEGSLSVLNLKCGEYRSAIKGLNPDDFPAIPGAASGDNLLLSGRSFCQGLSQVINIPIVSTAKPEISGVCLVFQKNLVKMVATDSFRLGEKTIFFRNQELVKNYSVIISQRAAREIINIFSEEEEIKIYFSANQILLEAKMEQTDHPKTQFVCRLIEGEFPNYEAIIPQKYDSEASFLKKEFISQIKSAGIFSGKNSEIKIKIDSLKNEIEIFGQDQDIGEYQGRTSAKIKGKDLEVAFNYKFLIEGILGAEGENVGMRFSGQESPAVIEVEKTNKETRPDYLYIIMPIKKV